MVLKARVWVAAFSGMVAAILLANLVFGMPATLVVAAAGHGWIFGMLRIGWIIIASIFLYNVAVETGHFQIMKDSIAGLSGDKRLQLILIAFCFGAFLEGTGGGGAPVAITGAFLIGLGFNPFQAAVLCLVANTAPVAWGGIGNPIRTLAGVTGLPEMQFSAMTGRILPPLAFILPLWLVRSMVGWKQTFEVWPALFVSGFSFALMQYYWSNHQEVGLVDIVSAIFSLLATVALLKFWRPATIMPVSDNMPERARRHNVAGVLKGWSPFIIASVLIFIASWPLFQPYITFPELRVPMPALHNAVLKMPPVAPTPTPEDATVNLNLLNLPGTPVFIGGLIAALVAGLSIGRTMAIFGRTLVSMLPALAAVSGMVALAYVTRYSGMDVVLGLTVTKHRLVLSLLWNAARLARRGVDGDGRGIQRAVRQPAKGHSRAVEPQSHSDGRGQLGRRRHGQDDRRSVDRRGERCDAAGGQRGGDLQGRDLAQHCARVPRRPDRDVLRLPVPVVDSR